MIGETHSSDLAPHWTLQNTINSEGQRSKVISKGPPYTSSAQRYDINTSIAGKSEWSCDLTQGADWRRKLDSTPPTPTTRAFPSAPALRKFWEGETSGMLLGEMELREDRKEGGERGEKGGRRWVRRKERGGGGQNVKKNVNRKQDS